MQWAFARNGGRCRAKPGSSSSRARIGRDEVQPGDLLFFNTGTNSLSHVGIALDAESFVHAPRSNGVVRVERFTSNYWSRRYLGARRVD